MSDPAGSRFSIYMVLVSVFALLVAGGCSACALLLSRLHHRHRTKEQLRISAPEDNAINNQRQFCTLIRNLDHSVALLPPAQTVPTSMLSAHCSEEIELTLPPSPAPSPALKPAHVPKLDICNREREKLNRFHYADNQELEVWPFLDRWEGLLTSWRIVLWCGWFLLINLCCRTLTSEIYIIKTREGSNWEDNIGTGPIHCQLKSLYSQVNKSLRHLKASRSSLFLDI